MPLWRLLLLFPLLAVRLLAQLPLSVEAQRAFGWVFEPQHRRPALVCHIETFKPSLDFAFRYEIGYVIRCPLKQFRGKETTAGTVLRITPQGGSPVVLGQSFSVPGAPENRRRNIDFRHFREDVEFSGLFLAGEGTYDIDLAVLDDENRVYRKSWHTEAYARGNEAQAALSLKPGIVSALSLPSWNGIATDGAGLRLTVLLDAAPMNRYSRRLRPWDHAFLLGTLSSLLRQLPLASVRLVAFNLDQQKVVYRDDKFDRPGMASLAAALGRLQLGSVPYSVLERERGWAELLAGLVDEECGRKHPSDAVVFIGPDERYDESIENRSGSGTEQAPLMPLFYLKYFPHAGADFPDAIQRLTSARRGTTFKLHSPGDLAQALAGLQKRLQVTVHGE